MVSVSEASPSSLRSSDASRDLRRSWMLALALIAYLIPSVASGQDTPDFFREKCMSCHTIGGGRLTGPDLKDVSQRKDREWLLGFMIDPNGYIDRGDAYAVKLLEESRNVRMPALPGLTRDRCEKLLDLIEAESKLENSQFKGLQVSTRPFTDVDRALGRDIFLGKTRLTEGGTACISCHGMHDIGALGGGRLGPELTNIYERLEGRKSLSAWLMAPSTATMQPIFKNKPMTPAEIEALVAYFEASAGETQSEPSFSRISLLLIGLVGAAGVVFGFDAIWKFRFHSVRQPLVDGAAIRGH